MNNGNVNINSSQTAQNNEKNHYEQAAEAFLKRTEYKSLSQADKDYFVVFCRENQLNPLKGEVYIVPYKDRVSFIIAFDVYLKRALATKLITWWGVEVASDNSKATLVVERKDFSKPFRWTVLFREVKGNSSFWRDSPTAMLTKTAIGRGMQVCFADVIDTPYTAPDETPEENGGFYESSQEKTEFPASAEQTPAPVNKPAQLTQEDIEYRNQVYTTLATLTNALSEEQKTSIWALYQKAQYDRQQLDNVVSQAQTLVQAASTPRPLEVPPQPTQEDIEYRKKAIAKLADFIPVLTDEQKTSIKDMLREAQYDRELLDTAVAIAADLYDTFLEAQAQDSDEETDEETNE
jgi:hypothetical protein